MKNIIQNSIKFPLSVNFNQIEDYAIKDNNTNYNCNNISLDYFKSSKNITNSFNDENNSFNLENKLYNLENFNIIGIENSFDIINNANLNSIISKNNLIQYDYISLKNNKKVFKIAKDFKGKGRIRKKTNYVGKHTKFSEDNIIRKIKAIFLDQCRNYINFLYKKYLLMKKKYISKKKVLLQRIESKITKQIKKEYNLKWLETKLYEIFSNNVSNKCCHYNKDYIMCPTIRAQWVSY